MRTRIVVGILVTVIISAGVYAVSSRNQPREASFRTAPVERGAILSEVSCTGAVNPVMTVKVGAEVTGKITELLVDFNSEVTRGQLIARIDPEPFEARVTQGRADVNVAIANVEIREAAVERALAELGNAKAELAASVALTEKARVLQAEAKRELVRMTALHESHAIPVRQFEQTETSHNEAVANLNSVRAQEESRISAVKTRDALVKMEVAQLAHAKAQVEHRRAALNDAKIELAHTEIRSPVSGVVVSRDVDLGETVVARLQSPLLFTIAQDPRKMQLETRVDEADIGRIRAGQTANFTVDTFPGRTFSGLVDQIRKAPNLVQNVVTYTVIVMTNNDDMALLPGMTASVRIIVKKSSDSLKIPNAALRFRPLDESGDTGKAVASTGGDGSGDEGSPEERLRRLVETLKMDKDQQVKVWQLYQEARQSVAAVMVEGAKPEEIKSARDAQRRRIQLGIEAMLTDEQKNVYRSLSAKRGAGERKSGRVWVLGPDNRPTAKDITIGVSDGAFTEVISGDIKEGWKVIVGLFKQKSSDKGLRF